MPDTLQQYQQVCSHCREVFSKKTSDYGTAWRILRPSSLTDQIFIKAQRIRTIEEKGIQQISDDIHSELVGIVNYCIIALVQLTLPSDTDLELPPQIALQYYDAQSRISLELMEKKNHDYGEAWRMMRTSSFTDLILMKVLRVKQIEDNQGRTILSEGVAANYQDMMNYAIFFLIKLDNSEVVK